MTESQQKYLTVPIPKNPYSRIGPLEWQDWYRQLQRTVQISQELKGKGNDVVIAVLSNFQPKGKLSEIEIYTEMLYRFAPELSVLSYKETN
jgi:hypothetical protein